MKEEAEDLGEGAGWARRSGETAEGGWAAAAGRAATAAGWGAEVSSCDHECEWVRGVRPCGTGGKKHRGDMMDMGTVGALSLSVGIYGIYSCALPGSFGLIVPGSQSADLTQSGDRIAVRGIRTVYVWQVTGMCQWCSVATLPLGGVLRLHRHRQQVPHQQLGVPLRDVPHSNASAGDSWRTARRRQGGAVQVDPAGCQRAVDPGAG